MTTPGLAGLRQVRHALDRHLRRGILPFWTERAQDTVAGGYHTAMDPTGVVCDLDADKLLVTQARLVWCFSALHPYASDPRRCRELADHGVDFLLEHFRDTVHGGWHWRASREGLVRDDAKLVYGQSFALYALAAHSRAFGDPRTRAAAEETFLVLQVRAADNARGGWYENLAGDWTRAASGGAAGDRKSLDVHMHLLEAFTELFLLTGEQVHRQRLEDVRWLLMTHMIDPVSGAGGNQYDLRFAPLAPVVIDRTWIAERPAAQRAADGGAGLPDTTSYGHNLELLWLLLRADAALGRPEADDYDVVRGLASHALEHGYDHRRGGVFREGPHLGPATDRDKEFWQNSEALVGWLEAYRVTREERFLDAFLGTWRFACDHLIEPTAGEWRTRVRADGEVVVADLGNRWKVGYHTGRAVMESLRVIDAVLASAGVDAD